MVEATRSVMKSGCWVMTLFLLLEVDGQMMKTFRVSANTNGQPLCALNPPNDTVPIDTLQSSNGQNVPPPAQCAHHCTGLGACHSFNYKPNNKHCAFYYYPPTSCVTNATDSGCIYYKPHECAGMTVVDSSCQVINQCASSPCLHSGTCIDEVNRYTCSCRAGYTGVNCQTDINECVSSPCLHIGICIDGVNRYKCSCQAGYTGVNCQTDINDCASSPCQNGGTCTDGVNSFSCSCLYGYSGKRCGCPPGFSYDASVHGCYKFVAETLTWSDAGVRCKSLNSRAHLAIISSATENAQVLAVTGSSTQLVWLAGQRIDPSSNSAYVWRVLMANGTVEQELAMNYKNWAAGEPSYMCCLGQVEACVGTFLDAHWNDGQCNSACNSVCEVDIDD